jgi:hypothetical protein
MTDVFEQPPSLVTFTEAVRSNDDKLVHGLAIAMLGFHLDASLKNQPELWTPNGRCSMSLEQTCTLRDEESGEQAATAGSTVEVSSRNPNKRRYSIGVHSTLNGMEYQHTAEWGKGDERMMSVKRAGNTACGTSYSHMSADLVEMTVMHAHPDLTEIVAPTGLRAVMRLILYRGTRTLYFAQSRIPGMVQSHPED